MQTEPRSALPLRQRLIRPGDNPVEFDDDGSAPGMIIWVLASHSRRHSTLRETALLNTSPRQKLYELEPYCTRMEGFMTTRLRLPAIWT